MRFNRFLELVSKSSFGFSIDAIIRRMFLLIPIPITRRSFVVDRELVAAADRDAMLKAARQVFDELGFRIHKNSSSEIIHWPGGLGRATPAVAAIANAAQCYYRLSFRSLGVGGLTDSAYRGEDAVWNTTRRKTKSARAGEMVYGEA